MFINRAWRGKLTIRTRLGVQSDPHSCISVVNVDDSVEIVDHDDICFHPIKVSNVFTAELPSYQDCHVLLIVDAT